VRRPRAVTGDQVAAAALRYQGAGYIYGGPAARPGDWDCSSFVSYVLGHDLGLALPGGKFGAPGFPPNAHGPVVEDYAKWNGAVTVGAPARGDLVCYVGAGVNGHIGFAIGPNSDGVPEMVSALDSRDGTKVTPIQGEGPPGAPIVYRRILGVAAGSAAAAVTTAASGQQGAAAAAVALVLVAVMAGAVLAAAAAAGAGLFLVATWAASRVTRA
jgi:cell wall-associated NlpC family hydrolase